MDASRFDSDRVEQALTARIDTRISTRGAVTFPAVPAMIDIFTEKCVGIFGLIGRKFNDNEVAQFASILHRNLSQACEESQRSSVTVNYLSTVAGPVEYTVTTHCQTIEEAYHHWVATREPPLFGTEPDARIWALAGEATDPREARVLDIGGGTGRNALALARRGHPVDVVEMTEKFAEIIRDEAARESLDVRVIQRDIFEVDMSAEENLRGDYSLVLLSEVVPEFRTADLLRRLFETAATCLTSGGRLVFNVFLTHPAYRPDAAAHQFAQQAYSGFFTRDELAAAVVGIPLELESDECVYDYEKDHLPDGAWPPTGWYADWVSGRDIFGLGRGECPVDMRWLVYRKR